MRVDVGCGLVICVARYFHASDVTKILRKLAAFNFDALIDNFKDSCNQESLLILGAPGTGKTHGISAISEKLFAGMVT